MGFDGIIVFCLSFHFPYTYLSLPAPRDPQLPHPYLLRVKYISATLKSKAGLNTTSKYRCTQYSKMQNYFVSSL